MKYNPAVRKNILLQEMTAFTNEETVALLDAWTTVSDLSDRASDELSQALTGLMKDLILKNIERSNRSRDLLNAFFDETGELDEDVYLLFKPVTLPETDGDQVETADSDDESEMELAYEIVADKPSDVEETETEPEAEAETTTEPKPEVETEPELESESTDVSVNDEEDQAVIDTLPETVDDNADEDVDRTADVAELFGQSEEEFNSRERADVLSSELAMPDGLGI